MRAALRPRRPHPLAPRPPRPQSSPSDVDPNGIFTRPTNLTADGGLCFDPATMGLGHYSVTYPVVGAWLKLRQDGSYDPDLAESVEVVDPTTITVHMRSGLQFSDGTPLDAQAAADSIVRTRDAKPRGLRTVEMSTIAEVTVDSPTQFTVKLSAPQAGFIYPLFADAEMSPVSPKTIAVPGDHCRDVVTAGPFKISSYPATEQVQMVKNDLYWDADNVRLAGITYLHAEGSEGAVNSLRAGQTVFATGIQTVTHADLASLQPPLEGTTVKAPAPFQANMCISPDTPFGDIKVRQALAYATDRDQINDLMYGGQSEPAWSLVPKDHPLYNDELENLFALDTTKAKQLLAEAGYPDGFEATLVVQSGDPLRVAEILQPQWEAVGVRFNIVMTTNIAEDWYLANGSKGALNVGTLLRGPLGSFPRNFITDAFGNPCHPSLPEVDACSADLAAMDITSDAYVQRSKECQAVVISDVVEGVMTVLVLQSIAVNTSKVGDLTYQVDAINFAQPDVTQIFIKK